jgi:hypothetical protein
MRVVFPIYMKELGYSTTKSLLYKHQGVLAPILAYFCTVPPWQQLDRARQISL